MRLKGSHAFFSALWLLFLQALSLACGGATDAALPSSISGYVFLEPGYPLGGILVRATGSFDAEPLTLETVSDANGFFLFQVNNGSWTVRPSTTNLNSLGFVNVDANTVVVNDSTNSSTYFLVRSPNARLNGALHDDDGSAITNAPIAFSDFFGNSFSATTDSAGHFSIALYADNRVYFFSLSKDYAGAHELIVPDNISPMLNPGRTTSQDIVLPRARFHLTVTIADENGQPLSDARLNSFGTNLLLTNGIGEMQVSRGKLLLAPSAPNFTIFPRKIDVTNSMEVHFVAHPIEDAVIFGRVVDQDDNVIPSFSVVLSDVTQLTDSQGRFSFSTRYSSPFSTRDTNYVLEDNIFHGAPGGSRTRLTLHARKVDSSISIRLTPPLASPFLSRWITLKQTVGLDTFTVRGEATNDLSLRLPAGEWQLAIWPYDPDAAIPPNTFRTNFVVSASDQSFNFDVGPASVLSTVRGRFVTASGSSFSSFGTLSLIQEDNHQVSAFASDSFEVVRYPGPFKIAVNLSPRTDVFNYGQTWLYFTFGRLFTVGDGESLDLGVMTVPTADANLKVHVLDSDGTPFNMDDPYTQFYFGGDASDSHGTYLASIVGTNNVLNLDLVPGRWTFGFDDQLLNAYGYAAVGAITANLHPGENDIVVRFKSLSALLPPPEIHSSLASNGAVRLSAFSERMWPLEVETSTDLVHWTYLEHVFNGEFDPAIQKTNVFYRVLRIE